MKITQKKVKIFFNIVLVSIVLRLALASINVLVTHGCSIRLDRVGVVVDGPYTMNSGSYGTEQWVMVIEGEDFRSTSYMNPDRAVLFKKGDTVRTSILMQDLTVVPEGFSSGISLQNAVTFSIVYLISIGLVTIVIVWALLHDWVKGLPDE